PSLGTMLGSLGLGGPPPMPTAPPAAPFGPPDSLGPGAAPQMAALGLPAAPVQRRGEAPAQFALRSPDAAAQPPEQGLIDEANAKAGKNTALASGKIDLYRTDIGAIQDQQRRREEADRIARAKEEKLSNEAMQIARTTPDYQAVWGTGTEG